MSHMAWPPAGGRAVSVRPHLPRARSPAVAAPGERPGSRCRRPVTRLIWLLLPLVAAPAPAADLRVPEDYQTIQSAIDVAGPDDVVAVAPGMYKENLIVSSYVHLVGLGDAPTDVTVQTNADSHGQGEDPAAALAVHVLRGGVLRAENLRFRNCFDEGPLDEGHSKCCQVDGVLQGRNLRLVGHSDTLQVAGFAHLTDSTILGTNDYVYGRGFFVCIGCKFVSRDSGAAILAPRGYRSGAFVITASEFRGEGQTHLARTSADGASAILLFNYIGEHVRPEGFSLSNRPEPSPGWWFWECGNTGPGADRSARVPWATGCAEQ